MELLLPFVAALLVATGVFLLLSTALIRVIIGLSFITYGANIGILIAGGGFERDNPAFLNIAGPYTDPLPQALILTAIVIGFATTALILVLSLKAYQATGTDKIDEIASEER